MLIKTKSPAGTSGYFSLSPDIKYRVLAICAPTTTWNVEYMIVRDEQHTPQVACIPSELMDIVDDTPEADWKGSLLTYNETAHPTVVLGFSHLSQDKDSFSRIHDLNGNESDMDEAFNAYRIYGGNVLIEGFNRNDEAQRIELEMKLQEFIDGVVVYTSGAAIRNTQYINSGYREYLSNLDMLVKYHAKTARHVASPREADIRTLTLKRLFVMVDTLVEVDGKAVPNHLRKMYKDLMEQEGVSTFFTNLQSNQYRNGDENAPTQPRA